MYLRAIGSTNFQQYKAVDDELACITNSSEQVTVLRHKLVAERVSHTLTNCSLSRSLEEARQQRERAKAAEEQKVSYDSPVFCQTKVPIQAGYEAKQQAENERA